MFNLFVWEDVESFEKFVWGIVYKKFYECCLEWFDVFGEMYFVMWWVLDGYCFSLDEVLMKFDLCWMKGDLDDVFGWDWLVVVKLYCMYRCEVV